ncbi:transcriptional regulator [Solibacillus silvestris]|nr:transcriptional regulator [Solibacillus silvestris]OBW59442.1 transcriptional regulator [Solibacillus silvestris]
MKDQLTKAMRQHQILDIMYMAKDRKITKRRIKLIKISGDYAQAYCFTRHAKRNFIIDNILAVHPVNKKIRWLEA